MSPAAAALVHCTPATAGGTSVQPWDRSAASIRAPAHAPADRPIHEAAGAKAVPLYLLMIALHAGLGLALKLYFFSYSA